MRSGIRRGQRGSTVATGLRLTGWLGLPAVSRAQPDLQYFFVNGRPVRPDHGARGPAVLSGYSLSGSAAGGRVYLDIDPDRVDVNAHPASTKCAFETARSSTNSSRRAAGDVGRDQARHGAATHRSSR